MAKIQLDSIRKELEQDGWKLISEDYKNLDEELVYECNEGHRVFAPWKKIRVKRECPVCKNNIYKTQENKIIPKKKGEYRILALDQATKVTGYAVFSDNKLVKYGTFETTLPNEIARDNRIKQWLISMIDIWKPDMVALEGIQYEQNFGVTVFATLARLQGILMSTLYEYGIPFEIAHTASWRNYCKVRGKTRIDKKRSMQMLVKEWYDVSVTDDCSDAIGIGKYIAETKEKIYELSDW